MTDVRRVKIKFGDAEFAADVAGDRIMPMYDSFILALEQRSRARRPSVNPRPVNFVVRPNIGPPEFSLRQFSGASTPAAGVPGSN